MNYAEKWVKVYEQERGHRPSEMVIQIAMHIDKVGDMLRKRGREDAQKGEKEYSTEVFCALVRKAFQMKPDEHLETVQAIADVWQLDYMEGYNAGKAAT